MKIYHCPMHPEVVSHHPGKCPKCGMALVVKQEKKGWQNYLPLIVVVSIISLVTVTLTFRDLAQGTFAIAQTLSYFMIGFFLTFAGFKLMDLRGFASGYATYDLLAQRWNPYGYVYPLLELFFGLAMIVSHANWLLWAEVIVMTFSGIGVLLKLQKKEKFQCACLGTFLKVPLTTVTLVEDFGMAILAILLLITSSS